MKIVGDHGVYFSGFKFCYIHCINIDFDDNKIHHKYIEDGFEVEVFDTNVYFAVSSFRKFIEYFQLANYIENFKFIETYKKLQFEIDKAKNNLTSAEDRLEKYLEFVDIPLEFM